MDSRKSKKEQIETLMCEIFPILVDGIFKNKNFSITTEFNTIGEGANTSNISFKNNIIIKYNTSYDFMSQKTHKDVKLTSFGESNINLWVDKIISIYITEKETRNQLVTQDKKLGDAIKNMRAVIEYYKFNPK